LLGKLPDAEVAVRTGRTLTAVECHRRALKIRYTHGRYSWWTPDDDALLGTASDVEIARRLGRSEAAIRARRINLHVPPFAQSK
jgi:hypothetical protein